jgi:hypothetical protein
MLRRTLVAAEWIPLSQWAAFLLVIFEHVCRRDEQLFRRVLKTICKRDFSTSHRAYLHETSPPKLLNGLAKIWSAYFDTGTLTTDPQEVTGKERLVVVHMRDLETEDRLLTMLVHAYLEQLIAMAGSESAVMARSNEQLRDGKLSCDYAISFAAPSVPVKP